CCCLSPPSLFARACALVLPTHLFFFFNTPPPSELSTLSLHDALPIFAASVKTNWRLRFRPNGKCGAYGLVHRCIRENASPRPARDRKSTRLNSSHVSISYAVFCLKKKKNIRARSRYASTGLCLLRNVR